MGERCPTCTPATERIRLRQGMLEQMFIDTELLNQTKAMLYFQTKVSKTLCDNLCLYKKEKL